jgi:hypothetical protein
MKDPQYVERLLNNVTGAMVTSLPERKSLLRDMPDATIGFLLGKGLSPQEVMDVTECWWRQGHEFGKGH